MTSVLHHGSPGSYKTFSIVQNVLIPALQEGRLVITNIRGFDSLEKIKTSLNIDMPASAAIWYIEPDDEGFKTIATFFHWAPAGALIVMDEGQRIYPTRSRRFDDYDLNADVEIFDSNENKLINIETNKPIYRPKTVENAFDQHRHFNWDIYISTPNISKIHKEIRHVLEWAYRHRNNSGLLPWYKNTWTEFRHDAENNGKSVSHYSGSPKRYKAVKKYFNCYQSTATGTAQDSNENISVFRDSKLRFMLGIIALCFIFLVYQGHAAYNRVTAQIAPTSAEAHPAPVKAPSDIPSHVPANGVPDKARSQAVSTVNPLKDAVFYYVGAINDELLFEVIMGNTTLNLTSIDLRRFGYFIHQKSGAYVALKKGQDIFYAFQRPRSAPTERGGELVEQNRVNVGANLENSFLQLPQTSAIN
jgi:zona occludens toxin